MMNDTTDGRIPYAARVAELATSRAEIALVLLNADGSEDTLTWPELHHRSTQVALEFRDLGITEGSRVGLKLPNSVEFVLAALAVWKLGATVIPIRWDLPDWEYERVVAVMGAALIIDDSHLKLIKSSEDRDIEPLPLVWSRHANGMLSSGSTGTPKVILRTAPGLYDPNQGLNRLFEAYGDLGGTGVVMTLGPMYHTNGFNTMANLLAGACLVVLERFDPGRILRAVGRYRVTGFVATSIMLQRMADDPAFETADLSSLQWMLHGAAPLPEWLARVWIERIGPEQFFTCYGSTERAGFTIARGDEYLRHPGTVGKGASGTEIRILNADQIEVPRGDIGEIFLRTPGGVPSRYLGADSLAATTDGFVSIGDLGWLDDDGYLFIADRRADLIISGGANVYPAEVEAAVSEHPDVVDVVVIGLRDPVWGRRVHAIVEPREAASLTDEEVRQWTSSRLARYKVPKTVEFVTKLARTDATKLNRSALVAERDRANGYDDDQVFAGVQPEHPLNAEPEEVHHADR